MNQTQAETEAFFKQFKASLNQHFTACQALIFPPVLSLQTALEQVRGLNLEIQIGAQNAHGEARGAYTGELSAPALREIGIQWVLLGHSERRQYFGETSVGIRARAEGLLAQGMSVMICVGETLKEREAGHMERVLEEQLMLSLPQIWPSGLCKLVVAYEPVWAIGTGVTASSEQAQAAHAFIRSVLARKYHGSAASQTPILYGGSVTPENLESLLGGEDVDGALVGGASLKPERFAELIKIAVKNPR